MDEILNWRVGLEFFYLFAMVVIIGSKLKEWRATLSEIRRVASEALNAVTRPEPERSNPVVANIPNQSTEPQELVPEESQPPPQPKEKPIAKKPLDVHEGILRAAGFAKREYGYSSYRLELESSVLGSVYEIWGIDLKRALEASGAKIGDSIRATLTGHVETSTMGDGEARKVKKKIWDVTKLE